MPGTPSGWPFGMNYLTANVAANRLLKTTLTYLAGATANPRILHRIRQLAWALDDVPPSDSLPDDWRAVRRSGPLFRRYEQALRWAEALLHGRGLGIQNGAVAEHGAAVSDGTGF